MKLLRSLSSSAERVRHGPLLSTLTKVITPCGTRTRNPRIRSPTPCPLGQGGSYVGLALLLKTLHAQGLKLHNWPVGPMDKASASGAGDSRFESWAGHMCAPRFRPVKSGDVPRHNSVALVDGAAATETLLAVSKCADPGATAFSVGRRRCSWSMGGGCGISGVGRHKGAAAAGNDQTPQRHHHYSWQHMTRPSHRVGTAAHLCTSAQPQPHPPRPCAALQSPPAGLEPAIFGLEVRRLVH